MKLQNKKTGEIIDSKDLLTDEILIDLFSKDFNYFNSKINKILEDWEDYEEPKKHYFITEYGGVFELNEIDKNLPDTDIKNINCVENIEDYQSIGNYFGTKEEAEKTVEKLKAWKRLKDKGFEITDWAVADGNELRLFGHYSIAGIKDDLDLLFGGEE